MLFVKSSHPGIGVVYYLIATKDKSNIFYLLPIIF